MRANNTPLAIFWNAAELQGNAHTCFTLRKLVLNGLAPWVQGFVCLLLFLLFVSLKKKSNRKSFFKGRDFFVCALRVIHFQLSESPSNEEWETVHRCALRCINRVVVAQKKNNFIGVSRRFLFAWRRAKYRSTLTEKNTVTCTPDDRLFFLAR